MQEPSVIRAHSWEQAIWICRQLRGWIFRGQENNQWTLSTSLERAGVYRFAYELVMLREFQRRARNHLSAVPSDTSFFDWLALMQHHGAVTRLLDFTASFYVAAFFALERAWGDSSIWCVNRYRVDRSAYGVFYPGLDYDGAFLQDRQGPLSIDAWMRRAAQERIFSSLPPRSIVCVDTELKPPRLDAQQGLFLVPTDITCSLNDNLAALFTANDPPVPDPRVVDAVDHDAVLEVTRTCPLFRVDLDLSIRPDALRDLWSMNIHAGTLFPGFDGFVRSLNYHAHGLENFDDGEVRRFFRSMFTAEDDDNRVMT